MHAFKVETKNGNKTVTQTWGPSIDLDRIIKQNPEYDIRKGIATNDQIEVDGVFVNPPPAEKTAAEKIAALYAGAEAHQNLYPIGAAGPLIMANAQAGKEKSLACVTWLKALWDEYYTRCDDLSTDTDFSSVGPMPHTVRECVQE